MGLCILIVQHCHVLNHQTLMNHFPFGRKGGGKSISLLLDIVPALHKAHNVDRHASTWTPPRLIIYTPQSSLFPPLCVSHLSFLLPPSFSPLPSLPVCYMLVIFHGGLPVEAVNTPLLRLQTQSDPATLSVSDASPKVSHSKVPVMQRSGHSIHPVIHQPARSPARSYWFLFPQSPRERERKD